jgi:hypothetical protein
MYLSSGWTSAKEFAMDQKQGVLEDPDLLGEVFSDMRFNVCLMYVFKEREMGQS